MSECQVEQLGAATDLTGRVVCAMSGGVDSSVAALLLKKQGYPVVGISMQVWDYRNHGGSKSRATCCAPTDFLDARKVAGTLDIPYYVMDLEEYFAKEVIDNFVESYVSGTTPNPCVECNRKVKFKELRRRAMQFGCSQVATGHYARITKDDSGYHLRRAKDRDKDQTYFLYGLSQEELGSTIFPIGDYEKREVRELARESGLVTADKAESQDICFVSSSVREFVERRKGFDAQNGDIVTKIGKKVGEHSGIYAYTVGQRKGLNVGGSAEPLYVIEIDPSNNQVVVGGKEELDRHSFSVKGLTVVAPQLLRSIRESDYPFTFEATAQLRHRHEGVPVKVTADNNGHALVTFSAHGTTVTPGQAAVFYCMNNDEVLAGATISRG